MAHPFSNRPAFQGMADHLFRFGGGFLMPDDADKTLNEFANTFADPLEGDTLWSDYALMQRGVFHEMRIPSRAGRDVLYQSLFSSPLTHGFAQSHDVFLGLSSREASRMHVGAIILDRFFRLAEAVGAATAKSAEHGQTHIDVDFENLDEIFSAIERAIGADLTPPPQAGKLFGLQLAKGIFTERHFDGIYGAWRAREWLNQKGAPTKDMIEIGGGAGYLTYYASKMGFERLAIIDLPQAICVQYMVLVSGLGSSAVQINSDVQKGVRLLTTEHALAQDFSGAQIVVNVDSFPEMPSRAAASYLDRVPEGTALLSINQESGIANGSEFQNVVSRLADNVQLHRVSRYPAWLRSGWVEEIYIR
jgi:hypothetical protein